MITLPQRRLMVFCFGAGLTLFLAGFLPFLMLPSLAQDETPAVEVTPEATGEASQLVTPGESTADQTTYPIQPTGDNGYCAVCHSLPWQAVTLQDGYILNLYSPPDVIKNSVHGANSSIGELGCLDCHTEEAFPHNGQTPTDARAYTLDAVAMCTTCHTEAANELQHGLHEQAILAGNRKAAVCTDCHGAHDIQPAPQQPQLVAGVCGECHEDTLVQWRSSAHVDIGPLGCATCHSPHTQTMRVGDNTEDVCLNCHTELPELFAHSTHLTAEADVTCVDCHMTKAPITNATLSDATLMLADHTMLLDTQPCTTCHEELVTSGKWQELTSRVSTDVIAERDALQERILELEKVEETPPADTGTLMNTLQGLLVGLGLGITFAAVFFTRGRHAST